VRESLTYNPGVSCRGIADPRLKWRIRKGEDRNTPGSSRNSGISPSAENALWCPGFAIGKIRLSINIKGLV
jgi:hypothetical protein